MGNPAITSFIFKLFKFDSLYSKIWRPIQNKVGKGEKREETQRKKKGRRKRKVWRGKVKKYS